MKATYSFWQLYPGNWQPNLSCRAVKTKLPRKDGNGNTATGNREKSLSCHVQLPQKNQ